MNAADLDEHFWLIVLAVPMLCIAGVALGFALSPRAKGYIMTALFIPAFALGFVMWAANGYRFLVGEDRMDRWGFAIWAAVTLLGAIAAVRNLIKAVSRTSDQGTHA